MTPQGLTRCSCPPVMKCCLNKQPAAQILCSQQLSTTRETAAMLAIVRFTRYHQSACQAGKIPRTPNSLHRQELQAPLPGPSIAPCCGVAFCKEGFPSARQTSQGAMPYIACSHTLAVTAHLQPLQHHAANTQTLRPRIHHGHQPCKAALSTF